MNMMNLDRRDMFKSLLALSAVGAVSACGGAQETASTDAATETPAEASASGFFNASEMAFIAAVSDTIIPTTDTPGAVAAGVPETIQALATDWGNDDFRTYWRNGLTNLSGALTDQAGGEFGSLHPEQKLAALSAYDASVFDGQTDDLT